METDNHNKPIELHLKVLVADDDAPTRILLKAAISQWGYVIVEAKDGEEALSIMQKENAPRILILDWLMPKLDGITLCEYLKKQLNQNPYIILLTQMTGATNAIKGIEAGADEFLPKPFNMAELRSRLSIGSRIIKTDEKNIQLTKIIKQLTESMTQIIENLDKGESVTNIKNQLHQITNQLKNYE